MVATSVLPFAGLELGDAAVVDRDAAHDLDVEMPLADRPLGGLAHQGERLDQQAVERIALPALEPQRRAPGPSARRRSQPSSAGSSALIAIDQHGISAQPAGMGRPGELLYAIQPGWAQACGHMTSTPSLAALAMSREEDAPSESGRGRRPPDGNGPL